MYHAATKQLGFRARALGGPNLNGRIRSALSTGVTRLSVRDGIFIPPTAHLRHNSHAAAHNVHQENEQDALQETFNKLLRSSTPTTKTRSPPKFGSFAQKKTTSALRDIWHGTSDPVDTPRSIFSNKDEGKSSISRLITSKPSTVPRAYENHEHHDSSNPAIRRGYELNEEVKKRLDNMTPSAIYQELRVTALRDGCDPRTIQAWCQYMVQDRAQLPNLEMFSALILVNVNPARGSTRHLKRILKEMEEHKVALDARTCHDILKVLSIHPDFLLVSDLLEYMQSRWFTLTDEGHRDLLLIYLRSDQTELALEKLDTMLEEGTTIQPWLFDIVIYHLCYLEEYDEILRLLQIRLHDGQKGATEISLTMWGIILDLAAKGSQSELMMYIWEQRVKPGYLYPPSGVCMNVMLSAVREGNTDLATEVFSLLGDRGITFDHSHYELLLEAYVEAGDLHGALDLLCVMQESRIEPDRSSIASLLRYLIRNPDVCTEAFTYLQQLKTEDDRIVPLSAVNALIESLTKTPGQHLSEAVEIYKSLKTVCPAGPNLETMNLLLEGCRASFETSFALSLASEMPILGLKPDARTYNALISSVLRFRKAVKTESNALPDADTKDRPNPITALAYYDEAQAQGLQLDFMPLYRLVHLLSLMGHERAMEVFSDMEMQFPRGARKLEELREKMQRHTLQRLERERANKGNFEDLGVEPGSRKVSSAGREDSFS